MERCQKTLLHKIIPRKMKSLQTNVRLRVRLESLQNDQSFPSGREAVRVVRKHPGVRSCSSIVWPWKIKEFHQLFDVLPHLTLCVRIPQKEGRVVSWHEGNTFIVTELATQSRDPHFAL